jgi:hypothetical protein
MKNLIRPTSPLYFMLLSFFMHGFGDASNLYGQTPVLDWALSTGATLSDDGNAVVIDQTGNAFCAGYHQATVDLDPGPGVLSAAGGGIFLQKFDPQGSLVWAVNYVCTGSPQFYDLALDANGNLLAVGTFTGTVDFDPGNGVANLTSQGTKDMFLLKLSASGGFNFVQQINSGAGTNEIPQAMEVDQQGNILVTGWFDGTIDADPGPGSSPLSSAGINDIFVHQYDANGNLNWARAIGSGGNDSGWDLTVDNAGNVSIVGRFSGTVDFDPGNGTANLTALGTMDGFLLRLTNAGNFVWAKPLATNANHSCTVMAIAADTAGNMFLGGIFFGSVDLDPGPNSATTLTNGTYDMFLMKTDASGNLLWGHGIGGNTTDGLYSLSTDLEGNVYAGGTFVGTVDFDPGPGVATETALSYTDIAVMKFDVSGAFEWVATAGGSNNDFIDQISVSPQNQLYVTGSYTWTADFAPGAAVYNLTSVAGADAYVYRLSFCQQVDTTTLTATTCDTFSLNSVVYDSSGTYLQHFQAVNGCDSVVILSLTVNPLIATLQANAGSLVASPAGALYQWLSCDSGNAAISGATAQTFVPTAAGNYAVVVSLGSCMDTSTCAFLNPLSIAADRKNGIELYPNPANERIHIVSESFIDLVCLFDIHGRRIAIPLKSPSQDWTIEVANLPRGIYVIRIETETTTEIQRLVLE